MNIKNIKQLASLLDESGLSAIEVKEGDSTIRLERNIINNTVINNPQNYAPTAPLMALDDGHFANGVKTSDDISVTGMGREFKSPIIGVFYSSPTPDSKPFVKKGSKIKKGDTICIIEAMKVLNEISSDCDGEILEVLCENGQVVEYGLPLFRIG